MLQVSRSTGGVAGRSPAFYCSVCGKKCASNAALRTHHMTHTGEKPFKCPHCEYSAPRNYAITKHVSRMHKDVVSVRAASGMRATSADYPGTYLM